MGGRLQGAGLPGISWTLFPSPMYTDDQHPWRPPANQQRLAPERFTEEGNHHYGRLACGETEALTDTVTSTSSY